MPSPSPLSRVASTLAIIASLAGGGAATIRLLDDIGSEVKGLRADVRTLIQQELELIALIKQTRPPIPHR